MNFLAFSLLHGTVECMDTYHLFKVQTHGPPMDALAMKMRLYLLVLSFSFLLVFGFQLFFKTFMGNRAPDRKRLWLLAICLFSAPVIATTIALGRGADLVAIESAARYFLGFPSAVLSAVAFYGISRQTYRSMLPENHQWYFKQCFYLLIIYGVFSGLVVPQGEFLLSASLNQNTFFQYTGVPVQVLRAASIMSIAYFFIGSMPLSISQRLLGTYSALFMMLLMFVTTGYISLRQVVQESRKIIKLEKEGMEFSELLKSFDSLYSLSRLPSSPQLEAIIRAGGRDFETAVIELASEEHEDLRERKLIAEIYSVYNEIAGIGYRIDPDGLERLKVLIYEIDALHSEEIKRSSTDISLVVGDFVKFRIAVFILGGLSFVLIWLVLFRTMVLSIRTLRNGAKEIASGNLTNKIEIGTADELADLADDLNIMRERLFQKTTSLETTARMLEDLSYRDGLTNLYNHRYFYNRLKEEISNSSKTCIPFSVLILDLDDFKKYNDAHGHPMGDTLLRALAETVRNALRGSDVVCRYGGEEFSVILPGTDKNSAMKAAEHVRASIECREFEKEETQPLGRITITIGVASFPVDAKSVEELVKKADDALYKAKHLGKNRVQG
ncbi:MAG: diguanylate cyclase [Thermodesulfobacteriota bacterium]